MPGFPSTDRQKAAGSSVKSTPRRSSPPSLSPTRRIRWNPEGPNGFSCRECYLLSIAMRCASAPLWAPATRTVSTPASYDAEIASLVTWAGSLNDRRNDP